MEDVPRMDEETRPIPTHCVVGGAHAFILRISSFFGLAPLRFESRSEGLRVSVSRPLCIYSYILVTVLIICALFGLVAEIKVGTELSVRMSSHVSQAVSSCDVLVVVVTAGAGVYGAPRRMRNMIKFMENLTTVDKNIGGKYSAVTERKLCAIPLVTLTFFTILIVNDFTFYALQERRTGRQWDIVTNYIGFYLLWYVALVLELQFAFSALSVCDRFTTLNDALAITVAHLTHSADKSKTTSSLNVYSIRVAQVETRSSNVALLLDTVAHKDQTVVIKQTANGQSRLAVPACEAFRRLSYLYWTLCEVVHQVDQSYGLPVIIILISILMHLIVTPYFLIMEITVSTNRIHFLVLQFIWCATHVFRMCILVEPSHYTINEGKRTENLVCRLLCYGTRLAADAGGLADNFARQLSLRRVAYTPLGVCILDRPLVASVMSAVTTYLVIVIQFQRYDT